MRLTRAFLSLAYSKLAYSKLAYSKNLATGSRKPSSSPIPCEFVTAFEDLLFAIGVKAMHASVSGSSK